MLKNILRGLVLASLMIPAQTLAQNYPEKAVTVVVPFSPGGSNDVIARYMSQALGKLWNQPFVVENRPGGGTAVGAAHVAKSKPDGYTALFVSGSYVINAATRPDLPFDPVNDLVAAATVATGDIGVISGPRNQIKTLAELVEKSKTTELFYATAGVGSQQHFYGALLAEALGVKMTAVPYPGGAEGLLDLLGGRVDLVVGTVSGMLATIENGATPVAIMSPARLKSLPDTPTAAEAGYPQATTQTYWFLFVPKGTPQEVIQKLHEGVVSTFSSPEGAEFLAKIDAKASNMSAADAQKYVASEIATWTDLAKRLNIVAK